MKQNELMQEIESVLDARVESGQSAPMSWVVHEVMQRHQSIEGADLDFYVLCGHGYVHATTREVLRRRKTDDDTGAPSQGDLWPGYNRVQRSYTIQRDGEQVVVRLEQMTEEEIRDKAAELRGIAHGAMQHADELLDYVASRARSMA